MPMRVSHRHQTSPEACIIRRLPCTACLFFLAAPVTIAWFGPVIIFGKFPSLEVCAIAVSLKIPVFILCTAQFGHLHTQSSSRLGTHGCHLYLLSGPSLTRLCEARWFRVLRVQVRYDVTCPSVNRRR